MQDWLKTPLGSSLLLAEGALYANACVNVFGFHAVQLGFEEYDFLGANRITNHWYVDECNAGLLRDTPYQAISAPFDALPFASDSLDLVLLPHVLEFAAKPHRVLREVSRVLRPEGVVMITGFNPMSFWGVRRYLTRYRQFPWQGTYWPLWRVKDWLGLLDFEINGGQHAVYRLPLQNSQWSQRLQWMEKAGDRWWPHLGAVYFIQGVKRVTGMRLIQPKWQREKKVKQLAVHPQRSEIHEKR